MILIAQMLQKAGLRFMSAKGVHRLPGGLHIDEIVCATAEEAAAVDAWAAREGFPVQARVASAEEVKAYEEIVW